MYRKNSKNIKQTDLKSSQESSTFIVKEPKIRHFDESNSRLPIIKDIPRPKSRMENQNLLLKSQELSKEIKNSLASKKIIYLKSKM